MENSKQETDVNYGQYYSKWPSVKVNPTEVVIRTFLVNYSALKFKNPVQGDRILEVGFGGERNTGFGLAVLVDDK